MSVGSSPSATGDPLTPDRGGPVAGQAATGGTADRGPATGGTADRGPQCPPTESQTPGEPTLRRGPLRPGELVRLTDAKGRSHTLLLEPGRQFHTHRGAVQHDELIGCDEGVAVQSTSGSWYLALRPTLADYVVAMPRGAAVVYPKDAGQMLMAADVFPGAHLVEAGAGSGALSCVLLRAVGAGGRVVSFERRAEFAAVARRNVIRFFGGWHTAWDLVQGDLADAPADLRVDQVLLDLLAPWEVVEVVARLLRPGGLLCAYLATTTQLSNVVERLRAHGGFGEPTATETLQRQWHVEGLAVRPAHRMVGHTGFLVTARRLAPGVRAPAARRRPAKGAWPAGSTGGPAGGGAGRAGGDPAVSLPQLPAAEPRGG